MIKILLIWLTGWIVVCIWTAIEAYNSKKYSKEKRDDIVSKTVIYSTLFWPLFLVLYISTTIGEFVNKTK